MFFRKIPYFEASMGYIYFMWTPMETIFCDEQEVKKNGIFIQINPFPFLPGFEPRYFD
jgi:hypothetical protein